MSFLTNILQSDLNCPVVLFFHGTCSAEDVQSKYCGQSIVGGKMIISLCGYVTKLMDGWVYLSWFILSF